MMMSAFSSEWLSLREPIDHRSRDSGIKSQVSKYFSHHLVSPNQPLRVLDLGCGTGSNLRAVASLLPDFQHWTLTDHDLNLLHAAREALQQWGDVELLDSGVELEGLDQVPCSVSSLSAHQTQGEPKPMLLKYAGKTLKIEFCQIDLAIDIEHLLGRSFDLVTAAAFFDLVSESWIKRFCENLQTAFYTALTYNGVEQWLPGCHVDGDVLKAFHQDQKSDKGFGIAAGPKATDVLVACLKAHQFVSEVASSPWVLEGRSDLALIESLAEGSAHAVRRTGVLEESVIQQWTERNRAIDTCEIGHFDLWAYKK
jgi:SAM-dependent methyltransferase